MGSTKSRIDFALASMTAQICAVVLLGCWFLYGLDQPNVHAEAESVTAQDQDDSRSRLPDRSSRGLIALYEFNEQEGTLINDRSGFGQPLNLEIDDVNSVEWKDGSLQIVGDSTIRSKQNANKIIVAAKQSAQLTIEAWIETSALDQDGPARIVTISKSPNERNVTFGQDGRKFDVRLRTTGTSNNGIPSTASNNNRVEQELTHVVYTRNRSGRSRLYLNGELDVEQKIEGALRNWDANMPLSLGNEIGGQRPWLGTIHLLAIYNRDLLPREVSNHYRLGPEAETVAVAITKARTPKELFFESTIAPLLAEHCLECHDSGSSEGGLDLSLKAKAEEGGDSGHPWVPSNANESLVWQLVESNDMPADRPPLSDEEKEHLKKWLDDGATWTWDKIEPDLFANADKSNQNWLRRLTVREYVATVRDTVGVNIESEARELLPPDLRADGFSNTSYNLSVDLKHIDAFAELASIIVERMDVEEFVEPYGPWSGGSDDRIRDTIRRMGKWLLRGPLEQREVETYFQLRADVQKLGSDDLEAIGFVLEAMLQSPRFVYRIENQRGDGSAWPVDDYELATRLSYALWGAPPDQELMRAVDAGEFGDFASIEKQVDRMLNDPRAVERSLQFAGEWLFLARLESLRPAEEMFPDWNPLLADDMRQETLSFFKAVAWDESRPLEELLNAQFTFLTPRLARHYQIDLGELISSDEISNLDDDAFVRVDLSEVPSRGGLLTHGSTLTVGGDDASMVTRGLFVLGDFLRGTVKDPPPCVDTTPVPTKQGLTRRDVAESRIANASCGGCHSKFEPFAFGLERYDGLGSYFQTDEHGNSLREDGELRFPNLPDSFEYENSQQLMDLLAKSDRVSETITWKMTQFILGRPISAFDAQALQRIHALVEADATYASRAKAIVMSELVLMTRTEKD